MTNAKQKDELSLELSTQVQNETNTAEYKRDDCEEGKITDADEILELRRNQRIDIMQNAMLGDYASDGAYILADEIRDEMLKAKKVITNNYENYIFAQTLKPIGDFGRGKFFVVVSKLGSKLCAVLTFVEPVHKINKLVTNAQASEIATFVDKAGEQFYIDMKREFNIVDDDYVYPENIEEFKYSKKRKKQMTLLWKESVKAIEKTERVIFEKRMQVLNENKNEYSQELNNLVSNAMSKKASFFDRAPSPSLCMNQMLDECIDNLHGKFTELEGPIRNTMIKVTKAICNEQTNEIEKNTQIVREKLQKEEKPKIIEPKQITPKQAGKEASSEFGQSSQKIGKTGFNIGEFEKIGHFVQVGGSGLQQQGGKKAPNKGNQGIDLGM